MGAVVVPGLQQREQVPQVPLLGVHRRTRLLALARIRVPGKAAAGMPGLPAPPAGPAPLPLCLQLRPQRRDLGIFRINHGT